MSKINFRNIKIGQLIKCKHVDDNGKNATHIFLVIYVSQKYLYAVQGSSVKTEDDESYFSRNNFSFYEPNSSAFEYKTHINLESLYKIDQDQIKGVSNMLKKSEFLEICDKLLSFNWKNSKFSNHNQIFDFIKYGSQNYNQIFEILFD